MQKPAILSAGLVLGGLLLLLAVPARPVLANADTVLANVCGWDRAVLAENYERILAGDPSRLSAYERLLAEADAAVKLVPGSVMEKEELPPSGDRHDYMSLAIYYWPNPRTADGLPWVSRDGERNPGSNAIPDKPNLGRMQRTVETLALAYFFSGDERYAEAAAHHLRVWFVEPTTRMNPNLQYAQGVPGQSAGRCWGIIDTAQLGNVCDCAELLVPSPAWTKADDAALRQWFASYLDWLLTSANGLAEGLTTNNHGTWYDAQVVRFALFAGERDQALKVLQAAGRRRIASQIKPDGRQPQELKRTKSWDYSVYNLMAFVRLAQLGACLDVDLWHYRSADGAGISQAFEFLLPYAQNPEPWSWQQIVDWNNQSFAKLLLVASQAYDEPRYRQLALELGNFSDPASRDYLLYALP